MDYSQMDCLFVAVLSHGDENHLFAVDRAISYEMLTSPLKGEKLDEGKLLRSDAFPGGESKQYFIAKESDFLLAYSTVPGYYSWRNCANGSWFVQAFCEVMLRDGRRLEFVQLLTRVNRMVSYTFQSNASQFSMTNKKQSPCITSMLTKSLYFA
ncbi:CASP7 [Bugula neritina]|uniref:CASP7 n=1 Tax=Bugula neritina TaxID=10212 RepID=A0A7J7KBI3_BUGNE|nr:CASP7 [Bugula neritina]